MSATYDPDLYAKLVEKHGDDHLGLALAQLAALREWADPDPDLVAKLPKGKEDKSKRAHCNTCGGFHDPSMFHLDYLGHADVTKVLLSVDPFWSWEPVAWDGGEPAYDRGGNGNPIGLWIRLTVAGVTRLGYGSVDDNKADAEKELIGDALRNAAMRFGVGVSLWSKADQGGRNEAPSRKKAAPNRAKRAHGETPDARATIRERIKAAGLVDAFVAYLAATYDTNKLVDLDDGQVAELLSVTASPEGLATIEDFAPVETSGGGT